MPSGTTHGNSYRGRIPPTARSILPLKAWKTSISILWPSNVNDGYAHQVGDALLVQVAKRLTSLLRKEDIVCRIGGDEFTIVLESIEKSKDASAVIPRCMKQKHC